MEKYLNSSGYHLNQAQQRILIFLKLNGPQPAGALARELNITNEGARLHLLKLAESDLVQTEQRSKGVGRPVTLFKLTEKGSVLFPDAHADLTVQLLHTIKDELGKEALNKLISAREKDFTEKYNSAMDSGHSLEEKLSTLVRMRTEEGYMATWEKNEDGYMLVENHCPICSAAKECEGFCSAEINNFRNVLGNRVVIERAEHIIKGDRRCAYRIKTKNQS